MLLTRVIPCLLKKDGALVKTINFKKFNYIGDPINTLQIYNNLLVDELVLLDISASRKNQKPDFDLISDAASECFMPLAYGGGIKTMADIRKIFSLGVEKVIICSQAVFNPKLISEAAQAYGNQSIVVAIDVKKNIWGKYQVMVLSGTYRTKFHPVDFAQKMAKLGAGEILLNSIDQDGKMQGYDLDLIRQVARSVNIPVVACGGAGEYADLGRAKKAGAAAAAAGSLFVYQKQNRAVLVNYPTQDELRKILKERR